MEQIYIKDSEIEELQLHLYDKLMRIHDLETEIKIRSSYIPVQGDSVDELLAQYFQECPVPVKRLNGGFYLFGLKKIYAKILNEN